MTATPDSSPRADTEEAPHSESRPPTDARIADALASGRSYHERQRDLVQASLITPWGPERVPARRQA